MSDNISDENISISGWKSNTAYMIALISWSTGLVNVYHTPRLFLKGTFLDIVIAYIFLMILMGIPMMQMELAMSQYSGKSVIGSWDLCPLFRGVGYSKVLTIIMFQFYYNILNSYFLLYCFSVIPTYETLEKCHLSSSNASNCFDFHANGSVDKAKYGSHAEKFWFEEIMHLDDNTLEPRWKLVGCLCGTMVAVFLANYKGTENMEKILSFLFAISSIETVIFLYFVTITPGSLNGMKNFFSANINFDKIAPWRRDSTTFLTFQAIFFSLGIGLGKSFGHIQSGFGPYKYSTLSLLILYVALVVACGQSKTRETIFRGFSSIAAQSDFRTPSHESPIWINLMNFGNTILHPFLMANLYGIISHHNNESIEKIKDTVRTNTDISYIFTVIPNAILSMPGHPQAWQFIIYSSIYLRGLSSSILMASTVLQVVYETRPSLTRYSCICALAFSALLCFPGWILHTNLGKMINTFINDITYTTLLPLINTVQVIAIVFFYHILHLADDVYFMLGFPASAYFQLSLVITSFLLPMFTVISLVRYFEETHVGMTIIMQKCFLTIILVWIPFMALVRIIRKRKWTNIISPSSKWGPPKELRESRRMFSKIHSVEEYMYEKYLKKNKLAKYE